MQGNRWVGVGTVIALVAAAAWLGWHFTGPSGVNEQPSPRTSGELAPKRSLGTGDEPGTLPKRKPVPIPDTPAVAENGVKPRIEGLDAETTAFLATQERVEELIQLALEDDPAKHEPVYEAVLSSDEELRDGAIEALVQFVGPSALPRMKQMLTQLSSPEAKAELQEAIEFLELPSIEDVRPRGRTSSASAQEPRLPRVKVPPAVPSEADSDSQ